MPSVVVWPGTTQILMDTAGNLYSQNGSVVLAQGADAAINYPDGSSKLAGLSALGFQSLFYATNGNVLAGYDGGEVTLNYPTGNRFVNAAGVYYPDGTTFFVGQINGGWVLQVVSIMASAATDATTPGTVIKKLQVLDGDGNLLGFIPVYDTID